MEWGKNESPYSQDEEDNPMDGETEAFSNNHAPNKPAMKAPAAFPIARAMAA